MYMPIAYRHESSWNAARASGMNRNDMTIVAAVKKRPCAGGWNCTAPGRPWHREVTEA